MGPRYRPLSNRGKGRLVLVFGGDDDRDRHVDGPLQAAGQVEVEPAGDAGWKRREDDLVEGAPRHERPHGIEGIGLADFPGGLDGPLVKAVELGVEALAGPLPTRLTDGAPVEHGVWELLGVARQVVAGRRR